MSKEYHQIEIVNIPAYVSSVPVGGYYNLQARRAAKDLNHDFSAIEKGALTGVMERNMYDTHDSGFVFVEVPIKVDEGNIYLRISALPVYSLDIQPPDFSYRRFGF
ncbi:MAG: hypothetical protein U0525_06505 [Patescibacteria group bacterium]